MRGGNPQQAGWGRPRGTIQPLMQPVKHRGTPTKGVIMFSDMVPRLGRGPRPETQAGSNPRGGLLWGYGGVNICPTVVPAPDDTVDVDEYIEYNDDTIEE